jgi:osmotically-inducible protein OsmY
MKAIVLVVGALALVAGCAKDKTAVDSTPTQGASAAGRLTADDIRSALLEERPSASDEINRLTITNDNGLVTLRGKVDDAATRDDLVNRVRAMNAVHGVRDEVTVEPRMLNDRAPGGTSSETVGQTTTTGAEIGASKQDQSDVQTGRSGEGANATPIRTTGTKTDAVRDSMMQARPDDASVIEGLTISASDEGRTVTVAGPVPDSSTHRALLAAAKRTSGVHTVKDLMQTEKPKQAPKKP